MINQNSIEKLEVSFEKHSIPRYPVDFPNVKSIS